MVDENRTEGLGHQIKGGIKQGVGKLTGDKRTEAEGAAEKTGGKAQETIGNAKDTLRDVLKR